VSKPAVSILPSRWEAGFAQSPAKPIRGTTLHALLCLLFPDRIALRFGFPDAPRSFGFCRQCICWRISRSLWNGTGGFGRGSDLLIFGEPASSAVFFFRLRFGGVTEGVSPDSAWITLAGSAASGGTASTFLRVRVFLIGGDEAISPFETCETSTGFTPTDFGGTSVGFATTSGVSRGGSGGTGAISSPPWSSRHTCSRFASVWFNRCSPS